MKYVPPRENEFKSSSKLCVEPKSPTTYWDEMRQQHSVQTVCVIGLGPAGLVAVKELREHGLHVTAMEASSSPFGPQQQPHYDDPNQYYGMTERSTNEFSDFAWYPCATAADSSDDTEMPTSYGEEVHNYLNSYANHFALHESFELETIVVDVQRQEQDRKWMVSTRPSKASIDDRDVKIRTFDAVVVCVGQRHLIGSSSFMSNDVQSKLFFGEPSTDSLESHQMTLYHHTMVPELPTLAFCGSEWREAWEGNDRASVFPILELCARYVAGIFLGRLYRPPTWQMKEEIVTRITHDPLSKCNYNRILFEMAEAVGVIPSLWWRFIHRYPMHASHHPTKTTIYPCVFRLSASDPLVSAQARRRFEECYAASSQSRDANAASSTQRIITNHISRPTSQSLPCC